MGLFDFFKRKKAADPAPQAKNEFQRNLHGIKAQAIARLASRPRGNFPNGRMSMDTPLGEFVSDSGFTGFPDQSRNQIIRTIRWLAQMDADYSGSLRDLINLANPGHTVQFMGSPRAVRAAQREFELWHPNIFKLGGGLDGLHTNQIREAAITGCSSVEWYPTKNKRGVEDAQILPGEQLRIARKDGVWRIYQTGRGQDIELDQRTYRYVPLQTDGDNPYGIPLFLGALMATDQHHQMSESLKRVVALMAKAVLLQAEVPPLDKRELEQTYERDLTPEEFLEEEQLYYQEISDLIIQRAEQGLLIVPEGVKLTPTALAKAAEGYPQVFKLIERLKFTGLRTTGFMRGAVDTTTEALAKVQYPMVEGEAWNIARVVALQSAFGIGLHMRLAGIPVTAKVEFQQAPSAFAESDAKTSQMRADTLIKLHDRYGDPIRPLVEQEYNIQLPPEEQQAARQPTERQDDPAGRSILRLTFDRKVGEYIPEKEQA